MNGGVFLHLSHAEYLVILERREQQQRWGSSQDDAYRNNELIRGASVYALAAAGDDLQRLAPLWPFIAPPVFRDSFHNCKKASAMLIAEMERLKRRQRVVRETTTLVEHLNTEHDEIMREYPAQLKDD